MHSLLINCVCRYQDIPDPGDSEQSLPLVTITDFATGEAGKETILLIGGEHARELITSEILLWLGLVLTGQENGFSKWPASVEVATQRKAIGLGRSILADWVQSLLLKVVFKVGASRDGNRPAVLQMVTSGTSCVLPVHETRCFQAYLTGC